MPDHETMDIKTRLMRWYLSPRKKKIERYSDSARQIQEDKLMKFLHRASRTEWGKKYGFDTIKSYADFAARVPVCSYDDLQESIERMHQGERDVLWPGRVRFFAKSSGTTAGRSKFIPVTSEGLRNMHLMGGQDVTFFYLQQNPNTRIGSGNSVILSGSFDPQSCNRYSKVGDVSAIMTSRMPGFIRRLGGFLPPWRIAKIQDFETKRDAIAEYCMHKNVTSFSGVPSWWLSVLTRMLELSGMENVTQVWPNLELFAHGGVGFAPYRELYEHAIPSDSMHYIETYNASEGFFGVQNDPADPAMLLMIDYDVFFEFLPLSGSKRSPVPLWEVETGRNYAMLITTSCGLWRYEIGDTVRFTSKNPYKFVISGRIRQFINAFGEELIVENAEKGIAEACRKTGAKVLDYTAAPVYMDIHGQCRHQWVVEFSQDPSSLEDFARELDEALRGINSDYDAKRFKDIVLRPLEVVKARKNLFNDWMKSRGKLGGQHKVPRLANSREYIDDLLEMNKA